jgi:hypothetical protein
MKRFTIVLAMFTVSVGILVAQAPEMPKPGPEHERLRAFAGNWTFEGEVKPGPMGPGGKLTGTDRIQWLPGNFFLERRYDGKGPMGEMRGLEIMGYDSAKKVYTYNSFDSMGNTASGTMTVSGNTWSASGRANMGGKTLQDRCKLTFGAGASTLAIACEISADGKSWTPTFEGKATKTK